MLYISHKHKNRRGHSWGGCIRLKGAKSSVDAEKGRAITCVSFIRSSCGSVMIADMSLLCKLCQSVSLNKFIVDCGVLHVSSSSVGVGAQQDFGSEFIRARIDCNLSGFRLTIVCLRLCITRKLEL